MRSNNKQLAPARSSRRSMLKGAAVGTAGIAGIAGIAAAGAIFSQQGHESTTVSAHGLDSSYHHSSPDSIQTILNIAITAEELAVVFYTEALNHANHLGLGEAAFLDITAAQVEEELHRRFLAKQGAQALTNTFSFPHGANTFKQFNLFIKTQQWLEVLFVAAYILAGKEFAQLQRPDLVQIAAQIGAIEAEHRALGRAIGGLRPADNFVFEPVFFNKVSDAPTLLKKNGFLSPSDGNTFTFESISVDNTGISVTDPSESYFSDL